MDPKPERPVLRAVTLAPQHGARVRIESIGERPEPAFLITKPFQRSTVKAAISQALFFDQSTVPA